MGYIDEVKGYVGAKVKGISYNIDLVDNCVLRCKSCAVGSLGGRKPHLMSIEKFRWTLDKAQRETKVRHVQLYIYSDPCQHPLLHLFVAECTRRGIETWISTMLQTTNCNFEKVIEARPTEFRISFPGFERMTFYQGGAKPERFKKKFAEVVKLPRHKETTWTMVFHKYKHNQHEIPMAQNMAEDNGIKFVALPSIFMPMEVMVEERYSEQDREIIFHLIDTPEEATARMKESTYCPCFKQIALDARGNVYLCQLIYEKRFILGDYLSMPYDEIYKRIRGHEFCGKCIAKKGNQYQSCYAEIAKSKDPVGEANRKRMQ